MHGITEAKLAVVIASPSPKGAIAFQSQTVRLVRRYCHNPTDWHLNWGETGHSIAEAQCTAVIVLPPRPDSTIAFQSQGVPRTRYHHRGNRVGGGEHKNQQRPQQPAP